MSAAAALFDSSSVSAMVAIRIAARAPSAPSGDITPTRPPAMVSANPLDETAAPSPKAAAIMMMICRSTASRAWRRVSTPVAMTIKAAAIEAWRIGTRPEPVASMKPTNTAPISQARRGWRGEMPDSGAMTRKSGRSRHRPRKPGSDRTSSVSPTRSGTSPSLASTRWPAR